VTRKRVLVSGLAPVLLLLLPLEIAIWGGWRVPLHIAAQLGGSARQERPRDRPTREILIVGEDS
jgi:hypothetical protein